MDVGKFLKDLFTEANGLVYDIKRIAIGAGIGAAVTTTFAAIVAVFTGHLKTIDFDGIAFLWIGIIGAAGGSIMLGRHGETKCDPPDDNQP